MNGVDPAGGDALADFEEPESTADAEISGEVATWARPANCLTVVSAGTTVEGAAPAPRDLAAIQVPDTASASTATDAPTASAGRPRSRPRADGGGVGDDVSTVGADGLTERD